MIGKRKRGTRKDYDRVLIAGQTDDGEGLSALRARPGKLDLAEIRPVKQGQHVGGAELVKLAPTAHSLVWDVDVQFDGTGATDTVDGDEDGDSRRQGPTRVASDVYRRNWDAIFADRPAGRSGKDRGVN